MYTLCLERFRVKVSVTSFSCMSRESEVICVDGYMKVSLFGTVAGGVNGEVVTKCFSLNPAER